ncbi:uncharacterized protein LOC117110992 [Anneissia japonica]|uniref:uncharacterized protein LOC117110992 n=1 Tax=Anneissia japonica TaxID=1529436 RepID=UPI0014259527|nr:uncharacterized protein LOC117110992 [Anneissia japonica]
MFQWKLLEALHDLNGVVCVADDVVIHGSTKEEHDKNLHSFLDRCKHVGIKLNPDKFEKELEEITFMGHKITKEGLQSDPEKIKSICDMPPPKNVKAVYQVVSDGGPQFSSNNFKAFSTAWGFQHILSSPGNSQSNGAAEAAVKVAKRLMKKCASAGEDPYIGLLNIRNTQTEGMTTTPTERLMGRKTKTILPTTNKTLTSMYEINDDI